MKAIITCILLILMFSYSEEIVPVRKEKKNTAHLMPKIANTKRIVNDLHILHPAFRNKVVMLIYECKKQGIDLRVVETYRTHERQDALKRRKLSNLSGGCSKHQHFIAVDVVPVVKGIPRWFDYLLWQKVGRMGEKQGLKWGGRWKMRDYGHFEYPIKIDSLYKLEIPDTVIIPLDY